MTHRHALIFVLGLAPFGCKKDAENKPGEETKSQDEAPAEEKKAEAEASDGADAAGEAGHGSGEGGQAVADCPESLSGKEKVDRVISKACGKVIVSGNYSVDGVTLTLEPGATLAFEDDAMLSVGYYDSAKLVVKGTQEAPVTFTSAGDKVAGVWKGVRLHGKANRSSLERLVIEYAGGDKSGALEIDANDVTLKSSVIRHTKEPAIVVDGKGTLSELTGNTFEDVGTVAMRVTPMVAGQIGEGNTFGDAVVHVMRGKLVEDSTWKAIGTPFVVVGLVGVDGSEGTRATLRIDPGAELRFDADGRFRVGYYAQGGFEAVGTVDAPILLTSNEKKEPGAWSGLEVHGKGEAKLEHVTLEYGGESEREGVLAVRNEAAVSVEHTTFKSNKTGVVVAGREAELQVFDSNTFEDTPVALHIPVRALAALGSQNSYAGEPRIVIDGGTVDKDGTWKPQKGAKVVLEKPIHISATVEVEPGYALEVEDSAKISVGYYDSASLRLHGTTDAPIELVGTRDDSGAWESIHLYGKAHGNVIENVLLRNAGGKAGIEFHAKSDGKVTNLTCEKCEIAALTWHKNAKVETSGIKAAEGTPKAEARP